MKRFVKVCKRQNSVSVNGSQMIVLNLIVAKCVIIGSINQCNCVKESVHSSHGSGNVSVGTPDKKYSLSLRF